MARLDRRQFVKTLAAAATVTVAGTKSSGQVRGAMEALVAYLRDGKKPAEPVRLLTPIAITSDNLNQAERLNEVK